MGYAFISYSSKNQKLANAMRELFKRHNIDTWMAPYDIPAGCEYAEVLYDAITDCSCLVLMLTDVSQNSQWVKKEVNIAITNGKAIIPVELEDVELNSSMKLYLNDQQIVPVEIIDEKSEAIMNILNRVICLTKDSIKEPTALKENKNVATTESKQKKISIIRKLFARKTNQTFKEESFDVHNGNKTYEDINDKTIDKPTNIEFKNYDDVLEYIFGNYGVNIIYNKEEFMQLMQRFATPFKNENRLLKFALDLEIYNKLKDTDSTNSEEQNSAYRFAFKQLRNSGIDSASSEKVIMWYIKHLDWKPTISVGKKLFFGNYPFEENGEYRKIEWEIIDIEDGNALLLSTYCLDAHNYDDKTCIWQNSSLKRWLEDEFRNNAFSNKENSSIVFTNNETSYNSVNGMASGDSTTDRVFILSAEQIKKLKLTNEILISKATPYAKKNGVFCDNLDNSFWWLRTPGTTNDTVSLVNKNGELKETGSYVHLNNRGIRPALWINIDIYKTQFYK